MTYRYRFILFLTTILTLWGMSSCIDDSISTRPADQPQFAADTLHLGEIYALEPSPTARVALHNPHDKGLMISRICFENADGPFRMNVDGRAGREFVDVEIRSRDSVFIFVEATFDELPTDGLAMLSDRILVTTNGVTQHLTVAAQVCNASRLYGVTLMRDTVLTAVRPIVIYDSLKVASGVTLTLEPGVNLRFHAGAYMSVEGTLVSKGTPQQRVDMTGDRRGMVAAQIPYDIMSGQWEGVYFAPGSTGNRLEYTTIRNTMAGVAVDSLATLHMTGCVLRNSQSYVLAAVHAGIEAAACEFAEGSSGLVWLRGGDHIFNHCTLANNYLFSVVGGPALQMAHVSDDSDDGSGMPRLKAELTNCAFGGYGGELQPSDLDDTSVTLRRCLLASKGADDDRFIDCLWECDPLFLTVRSDYLFDYRVFADSPAADAALTTAGEQPLLDPSGERLNPHIGAYAPVARRSDDPRP